MFIAIDFDGTCVTHDYPDVGKDIGAVPVLKKLIDAGHKLILHTMRSGETEREAVKWFDEHEIPLYGVNSNRSQTRWTKSPKVFANLYIDDTALGAPLTQDTTLSPRPFINWREVEKILVAKGIIRA